MYPDLVPDIREALGVSTAHDASIIRGLTRNARYFLRNFNFRESVRRTAAVPLPLGATSFATPADAGKVKAVRLRQQSGLQFLYKRLRKREEGQLPQRAEVGPMFYWHEPPLIKLDTPMPETGLDVEVWYQSTDPVFAEPWLSSTYSDVLTHRVIYEMAPTKRKPEAMQIYSALWQEDLTVLANYLQEIEFEDLEMRMAPDARFVSERYPST